MYFFYYKSYYKISSYHLRLTVIKIFLEICQVRLDFLVANFAQPDQTTGNCETGDRDVITLNAGGDDPNRVICGELTGQHGKL